MTNASDGDGVVAIRCNDDMDEPSLEVGATIERRVGGAVGSRFSNRTKGKPVADVRIEVDMALGYLLIVARSDLAGPGVDRHVEGFGK